MPVMKATEIKLSKSEKRILTGFAKSRRDPSQLKIRAQIILQAASGSSNNAIERNLGKDKNQVKRWRDRYANKQEQLSLIEKETPHKLRRAIIEVLSDAPRKGGPTKFRDEQVATIIAMACESPETYNLPFSHWTPGLLRQKVIELGIVESISVRHVGRLLKRGVCSLIVAVVG